MNRYENGKIYKIVDVGYNKCYIGSTCESLSQRMARHREKYQQYLRTGKKHTNIVLLFDEFGVENCKIELIENYPSDSKSILQKQEGHHIRNTDCVNKKMEGRTRKEYQEDNKERISERGKEWYENNKEYCAERARLKRELFNEEVNEQSRKSYYRNRDTISERRKEKYKDNKEQINVKRREQYHNYKEKLNEKRKETIECECGATTRKADISKHNKTKKHQQYLQSIS